MENNNLKNEEQNRITNFVLFYNEDEVNNPKAYDNSYSKLLKWVDDSIDIYKVCCSLGVSCWMSLVFTRYSCYLFL